MEKENKPAVRGTIQFERGLRAKNPELKPADVRNLRNQCLAIVGEYMKQGFDPAVVKANEDGSMDVIVLTAERLNRKGGR